MSAGVAGGVPLGNWLKPNSLLRVSPTVKTVLLDVDVAVQHVPSALLPPTLPELQTSVAAVLFVPALQVQL